MLVPAAIHLDGIPLHLIRESQNKVQPKREREKKKKCINDVYWMTDGSKPFLCILAFAGMY